MRDHILQAWRLGGARRGIGMADAGILTLAALRRRLVGAAAAAKHDAGRPLHDPRREDSVRARGGRMARLLGVPRDTAEGLLGHLLADARRLQGIGTVQAASQAEPDTEPSAGSWRGAPPRAAGWWLRLLPPPRRMAPLLRRVPYRIQQHALERAMQHVLAALDAESGVEVLEGRRIGIELSDLGVRWVVAREQGVMRACAPGTDAEATVRGSVTDLALLAARLEDADTLFFQRRLVLTGDTELGLTARNLLDRLRWEHVPLAARVVIHRFACAARAAREAVPARHPGQAAP